MSPETTPLSILNCGGVPGTGQFAASVALCAMYAFSAATTNGMAVPSAAPMQLFGVAVPGCAPVQSVEGLNRLEPSMGLIRNLLPQTQTTELHCPNPVANSPSGRKGYC